MGAMLANHHDPYIQRGYRLRKPIRAIPHAQLERLREDRVGPRLLVEL